VEFAMRIGEAARRAGVNVQTIRFYERRGLLSPARRLASGYRDYPPGEVRRVVAVKRAQKLGFTLSEIHELMRLETPGLHVEQVRAVAQAKIRDIDARIRSLKSIRKSLEGMLRESAKAGPNCPVLEEDR
jgi:MerR family transcriptional regulator, copper efflux regulator